MIISHNKVQSEDANLQELIQFKDEGDGKDKNYFFNDWLGAG